MRLWHQDLLPLLPRAQLLGQHRECAALRGRAVLTLRGRLMADTVTRALTQ